MSKAHHSNHSKQGNHQPRNQGSKSENHASQPQNGGGADTNSPSLPAKIAENIQEGTSAMTAGVAGLAGSIKDEIASDYSAAKDAVSEAADTMGAIVKGAEDVVVKKSKSLLESVKRDPIPAAIAGAGVICLGIGVSWMMISAGSSGAKKDSNSTPSKLASATRATGETLNRVVQGARSQGLRVGRAAQHSLHENPLAAGAALTAVGVAIGLAIPSTMKEDKWFGRERDQVIGKAGELARGAMDKVEAVAKQVPAEAR